MYILTKDKKLLDVFLRSSEKLDIAQNDHSSVKILTRGADNGLFVGPHRPFDLPHLYLILLMRPIGNTTKTRKAEADEQTVRHLNDSKLTAPEEKELPM